MLRTVEAVIEESGRVRSLEQIQLTTARRALLTILDETPTPRTIRMGAAPVSRATELTIESAVEPVHQTRGSLRLNTKTLRWVAGDKSLEYDGADT